MVNTEGEGVEALLDSKADDLTAQLNEVAQRHRVAPWAWAFLTVLLIVFPIGGVIAAALLVPAALWLHQRDRARRSAVVFYEVTDVADEWFESLTSADERLASSLRVWRQKSSGNLVTTHQRKQNAGANTLVDRERVSHATAGPPVMRTNIRVPTLKVAGVSLSFLPDRVVASEGSKYVAVAYPNLSVTFRQIRFVESETPPADAQRVGTTWKYANVKGGPDRRYKDNRELPVMQYGEIEISSPEGLLWILQVSDMQAAKEFADVLNRRFHAIRATTATPEVDDPWRRPAWSAPPPNLQPSRPQGRPKPIAVPSFSPAPAHPHPDPVRSQPGLFSFPTDQGSHRFPGRFAILDVETTGFAPARGDRIIEIAIAVVDGSGQVLDEYASLVNPEGRDVGPVYVHGITSDMVQQAPRFAEILHEIVPRLNGAVIVAHNAEFEERFLQSEFARTGLAVTAIPALCTLWLARRTMNLPNHKLETIRRHVGIDSPDAHTALGDVRTLALLLPSMIAQYEKPLLFTSPPAQWSWPATVGRPITRAVSLRKGSDGWMATLVARLPMSAGDALAADAEQYLETLGEALSDGRIAGSEIQQLAALAGSGGLGQTQIRGLNETYLESLREAAFADDILTARELKDLNRAAAALAVPDYFGDLTVTTTSSVAAAQTKQRRCGHCRQVGHYRPSCPALL